jgi:hypothetical protein
MKDRKNLFLGDWNKRVKELDGESELVDSDR